MTRFGLINIEPVAILGYVREAGSMSTIDSGVVVSKLFPLARTKKYFPGVFGSVNANLNFPFASSFTS